MSELVIENSPLPYESRLDERALSAIDLVVIHCTELPDLVTAREFGERIRHEHSQTGNSGHYYIERDGRVHQYVAASRVANHTFGYNARSIGIELVNLGRYPHWNDSQHQTFSEPYRQPLIDALRTLLRVLVDQLPSLTWIAGHEELDLRLEPARNDPTILLPRRRDPGPLFPWDEVMQGMPLRRLVTEQ